MPLTLRVVVRVPYQLSLSLLSRFAGMHPNMFAHLVGKFNLVVVEAQSSNGTDLILVITLADVTEQ